MDGTVSMPSEFEMAKLIFQCDSGALRALEFLGLLRPNEPGKPARSFMDVRRAFVTWCRRVEACFGEDQLGDMHWDCVTAESSLTAIHNLQTVIQEL